MGEPADPVPDIHALFCHYNSLYFGDALGACSVAWSSHRMTRSTGTCRYQQRGTCEIRLSLPLLKFRPAADLKNTLLHEMIHASLWIENQNKDRSDHGPNFQTVMNGINGSSIDDYQRPASGYNITVHHDFHAEDDNYQVYRWMCESCGDLIERVMDRAPSASDCIERVKRNGSCGNPSCQWHQHEMHCSGKYTKKVKPPRSEGKVSRANHKHQNDGHDELYHGSRKKAAKTSQTADGKDEPDVKKLKALTSFFPVAGIGKSTVDNSSYTLVSQKHLHHDSDAVIQELRKGLMLEKTARGIRSYVTQRRRKFTDIVQEHPGRGSDYTVMSRWLDWYVEEEQVCRDLEPLVNKRTERRKKHKMLMSSKRKTVLGERRADTYTESDSVQVTENPDPVDTLSQDP